jgi:hypothetical protein
VGERITSLCPLITELEKGLLRGRQAENALCFQQSFTKQRAAESSAKQRGMEKERSLTG